LKMNTPPAHATPTSTLSASTLVLGLHSHTPRGRQVGYIGP
jgi:hypothetical protein